LNKLVFISIIRGFLTFSHLNTYHNPFSLNSDVRHLNAPNQPPIGFSYEHNKNGRKFAHKYFKMYPWIHYDEESKKIFCFTCCKAAEVNNLSEKSLNDADNICKQGFDNWKKIGEKLKDCRLKQHDGCNVHMEAMDRDINAKEDNQQNIIQMTASAAESQRRTNRKNLLSVLETIKLLGIKITNQISQILRNFQPPPPIHCH
jgi:hypothetical protein